jgi:hypothetical protein
VAQLAGALRSLARGIRDSRLPDDLPLPAGEAVRPVADRIADVRRALTGEHAA